MADMVKVTYRGTLIDGSVFSTSEKLGGSVTFTLNYVVPGWVEALEMMKEGDKWRLFIPPNLGYGDKSPIPEIPANSTLIIDVELVQITPR
jgi:FKBP-type peptidyl-prolyl cis-trans isomerase FklB